MDNIIAEREFHNLDGGGVQTLKGSNGQSELNAAQQWAKENGIVVAAHAPVTDAQWRKMAEMCRFDFDNPPPRPVPVFTIQGESVATAGNLAVVQAQMKSGKTGFLRGAMATALDNAFGFGVPHLGICSNGEQGLVLHFDTEQSRYDYHRSIERVMKRIGADRPPGDLHSFWIRSMDTNQRRQFFFKTMEELSKRGRLKVVFLDGFADLIQDVNDQKEANPYVDELLQAAEHYGTVLMGNIHENPSGSESGKTRGHLGSQLARKAEANLRVEKDKATGVITVYSETSRNMHLAKSRGARFVWCKEAEDFMDAPTAVEAKRDAKGEELKQLAAEAFRDAKPRGLTRTEVIKRIATIKGISENGARHPFDAMREADVLSQNSEGKWGVSF